MEPAAYLGTAPSFSSIAGTWNRPVAPLPPAPESAQHRLQPQMKTIRFTPGDLDLFSAASHDRNPLHLSDDYSRRTPYGGRVVFGVLDGLAAMAAVAERPGQTLASIEFEFFDTALLGIEYQVSVIENPSECTIRVSDGRRPVLEAVLEFGSSGSQPAPESDNWRGALTQPKQLSAAQLTAGYRQAGSYGPALRELDQLCAQLHLNKAWLSRAH